jgi:NitT/TauT family transport system substrate-binding protein
MEPWISVAQKQGLRILIESHSTSEAAGDDLDGPTLAKMFRAQARAVELIEKDPTPYVHHCGDRRPPRAQRTPDLAAASRPAGRCGFGSRD